MNLLFVAHSFAACSSAFEDFAVFLDLEGVLNGYDSCSSCSTCSCCYHFRKMPKALLIRNGQLRNIIHIRDIIPDRLLS